MIEKIREIVKKESDKGSWVHIKVVVKYAKMLAKIEGANEEIAELAALLHDIGRVKIGPKDHEITGAEEAEKILTEMGYDKEIVDEVKHCVRAHRASKDYVPKTKTAEIVRDADAMAHFDMIPQLIKAGLKKNDEDIEKTISWLEAKIDRDWNNKMHLAESKRITEEKYKAAKLLIKSAKEAMEEN